MLAALNIPDIPGGFSEKTIAAVGTLATAFLAISYFALTWATDRMTAWEAVKANSRHGAPAQICWLAGAGILISCGAGTFLFGLLYISAIPSFFSLQGIAIVSILFKFLIFGLITFPYVWWYFGPKLVTTHSDSDRLKKLFNPHKVLRFDIWLFLVSCGIFIFDILSGNLAAGFSGLLYALFGSFGVGAYCGVIGDLLPRAQRWEQD